MSLPSQYRLRKKKDIETVFAKGATIRGRLLFIKFIQNTLEYPRIAVVVSKKVSTKAVIRNLLRRRIHASIIQSLLLKELGLFQQGYDIVVTVMPIIINKDFSEINTDLEQILKKIIIKR